MTEIERIKLLIAESEGVELNNWHNANYSQKEAYTRIQSDSREWLSSLITTIESQKRDIQRIESENKGYLHSLKLKRDEIESQKEEIEGLHDALEMLPPKYVGIHERTQFQIDKTVYRLRNEFLQKQVESLKAITELAVKGLAMELNVAIGAQNKHATTRLDTLLSEIERLQNDLIS